MNIKLRRPRCLVLLAISFGLFSCASASAAELESPNKRVRIQFNTDAHGDLVYSVYFNGDPRFAAACAGIIVDDLDLGARATIGTPRTRRIRETFPWRGNKTVGTNHCMVVEMPIRSEAAKIDWILEARLFDDGVAFRYRVPGNGTRRIAGESTAWQIPGDATLWFQTDTVNYEGVFQAKRADAMPLQKQVEQKPQPLYVGPPMTIQFADGTFGIISEAALYNYSGMTLRPEGGARFRATFEDDPNGWTHTGPIVSPWRVMLLSPDLNSLVNNDVIPALCDPPDPQLFPQGINTEWLHPGKAPCTWMVYGNDGAQWHRQKWWVDAAAATGCEYLLVDAGWRTEKWGWIKDGANLWERVAELCRYGAERKVGILLWHGYPEGRDDGPGLTTVEARDELLSNCQKAGVKGIKIDFFDSESKATIDAYEDILRRAAKHQLMVNFHGANKPTGEPRTWPNEMTREGIREQEYQLWDSLPLAHYGALPFTRMVAGHGDFLPGFVQSRFLKNTTVIFQMASAVVFSSPFLCWPDNPEAYLASPLLQFIRDVPVTWDETRILPGSIIGETVLVARRKEAQWYVAGLNCQPVQCAVSIDPGSLGLNANELTVYRDGSAPGAFSIEKRTAPEGKLDISVPAGGGFIIHASPPKNFKGWK